MATIQQYHTRLWTAGADICRKLGMDPTTAPKGDRVIAKAILFLIAVLIKVLVDKGVVTDAELNTAYQAAQDDAYPDEPVNPGEGP